MQSIAASATAVYIIVEDERETKIMAVNLNTGKLLWETNTLDARDIFTDRYVITS